MRKYVAVLLAFLMGACAVWATDAGGDIMFGVCRPNLSWEPDSKARGILDSIKESGAKCVQLTLRENVEVTLGHVQYCKNIGLPVVLLIMPLETFMEDGAKPRPGNGKLWTVYGLSQIDVRKFEKIFGECVEFFKANDIEIIGFEVFNEINWADFNGDLPVNDGAGIVLDEDNYGEHAFAGKYFKGMAVSYTHLTLPTKLEV